MKSLFLIDGNSLINRAFYALPPLTTAQGEPTNGVYGFMMMLFRLMDDYNPDQIMVAFDVAKPTFRHIQYEQYKAHRTGMPEDLRPQLDTLKEVLDAFGIKRLELAGYEADDVIGTVAKLGEEAGYRVYIVTGDRDALQLITNNTQVILTKRGISQTEVVDTQTLIDDYQVTPDQVRDLKGLMGDKSDNIPGVPGVGEKTALKLLKEYPSIEDIYKSISELKGKLKERLVTHEDQAFLSKDLATIRQDVPIEIELDQKLDRDDERLFNLFTRLEFHSFLERLPQDLELGEGYGKQEQLDLTIEQEPDFASLQEGLSNIEQVSIVTDRNNKRLAIHGNRTVWIFSLEQQLDNLTKLVTLLRKKSLVCVSSKELQHILQTTDNPLAVELDVELAAYCLNSGARQDLSALAVRYGFPPLSQSQSDIEQLAAEAHVIDALSPQIRTELTETDLWDLYHDVELPLAQILARMEHRGIVVEREKLQEIANDLDVTLSRLTEIIFAEAGEEFNINSPKQLGVILFEKLGLPVIKKTKTGPSTSAEVLEQLTAYPIVDSILEYRQVAKLKSTYTDALADLISLETGRIHTTFHQTITATGRLSSAHPNLQNIPIRTAEGRRIREAFVAPEGKVLISADYSQIELRVLAHISEDEALINAFRSEQDIHTQTAAEVFDKSLDEVTSEDRNAAKAINFGIVYGISSFGLAKGINLTRAEAQAYIDKYFARYPKVKQYMDETIKYAEENGYVTTLLKRRRYLPDIKSRNYNARSFAQRMAMNSPIQGSAADIIKLAMINVERALHEAGLNTTMLLQVHDELVLEVPHEELATVAKIVKDKMENVIQLNVPLTVDVQVGDNWRDVEPFREVK